MKKNLEYLVILLVLIMPLNSNGQQDQKNKKSQKKENDAFQHEQGVDANTHMHRHSIKSMVAAFESPERTKWQKPDEVVALMGDLKDIDIMDIGSGTGYFSFRMADKGANVICADVDDRFLNYIKKKKSELGYSDQQIEIRKVPYDSPALSKDEVEKVIIVNTYHHIDNREGYFTEVHKGLKPGGQLYVIDFLKKELDFGPPINMKLSESEVIAELLKAGFSKFVVNTELLPYQYIIIAE